MKKTAFIAMTNVFKNSQPLTLGVFYNLKSKPGEASNTYSLLAARRSSKGEARAGTRLSAAKAGSRRDKWLFKVKWGCPVFITILTLLGTFFNIANAQQQPDSLMEYLKIATRNNPGILQKYYEYQAALQKVPQVGSLADPELNVGIFLSPMELVGGKQVADIQLMQMFPWFGVLKNSKDEMSLMANAKFESLRDAKLQVLYDVQRTWYELYRIHKNIGIAKRNLDILQMLERISLVRYKTGSISNASPSGIGNIASNAPSGSSPSGMGGMGNNSASGQQGPTSSPPMQGATMGGAEGFGLANLYRIQIETGNLENNIALLNNQFASVAARFNAYLNRNVNVAIYLPDSLTNEIRGIPAVEFKDSLLADNPMLTMLQFEQQSLAARKRMVTKMQYPMVGVGLNYSLVNKNEMSSSEMNGEDMIMPMVKVTLPIYRKKYKAMQQEADYLRSANEQNMQTTANALRTEYFEAIQAYQDAERRMKLYRTQSQLANKSLDIMIKSFSASASGVGLSDILTVRQQTLDYETKNIEALVDFNTAVAWINRLVANEKITEQQK